MSKGDIKVKFWQKGKQNAVNEREKSEEITSETVDDKGVDDILADKGTTEDFTTNALSCFGWKKDTTEAWMIKCAKVWFLVLSFLYFVFGALTFAPIIFISNKLYPLVKDKKKSLIFAIVIYAVIVCLIVVLIGLRHTNEPIPTPTTP
jgi:hypothetical protein